MVTTIKMVRWNSYKTSAQVKLIPNITGIVLSPLPVKAFYGPTQDTVVGVLRVVCEIIALLSTAAQARSLSFVETSGSNQREKGQE